MNKKIDKLDSVLKKTPIHIFTSNAPNNYKIIFKGFIRSNTTKSLNIVTGFFTGIKQIFGGKLMYYNKLLVDAREDAIIDMIAQAEKLNANAIVGFKIDVNESQGIMCVFCYGSAVYIENLQTERNKSNT